MSHTDDTSCAVNVLLVNQTVVRSNSDDDVCSCADNSNDGPIKCKFSGCPPDRAALTLYSEATHSLKQRKNNSLNDSILY